MYVWAFIWIASLKQFQWVKERTQLLVKYFWHVNICLLFHWGYPLRQEFAPNGSKFVPLIVVPIFGKCQSFRRQFLSVKVVSLCSDGSMCQGVSIYLKWVQRCTSDWNLCFLKGCAEKKVSFGREMTYWGCDSRIVPFPWLDPTLCIWSQSYLSVLKFFCSLSICGHLILISVGKLPLRHQIFQDILKHLFLIFWE